MDKQFKEKTLALRGKKAGDKWLEEIPILIKEFEDLWSIKVGQSFGLYINYVAPATREDGSEVVIKICFPGDDEFRTEVESLKIFNGEGIVKLLDQDLEKGVLLLERLKPGVPISNLENDELATEIIAQLMKKIWKKEPLNHSFPPLYKWTAEFNWLRKNYQGKTGPIPEKLFQKAENLRNKLLATQSDMYLLHGDLHHENILSAEREPYLAVDPKGVIGEREYEAAAMLRNPYTKLSKMKNIKGVLERRIEILSESLDLNKGRIRDWAIAQTILSVIWNLQSGDKRWKKWLEIAEILSILD